MNSIAATSLLLGLLTTASPCILPLYPGFLAYLGSHSGIERQKYFLGLFVLAGVLTMMLALGGFIALLAVFVCSVVPFGIVMIFILPLADVLICSLGILLLFTFTPFRTLPQIQLPLLRHPYGNAYVYGLLYSPIALPCSGPMVLSIFALSFTVIEAF